MNLFNICNIAKIHGMATCYLGLGSNIGDRSSYLSKAIQLLDADVGPLIASSSIYETEAWGVDHQEFYLNMVVELEHYLQPENLLKKIQRVEYQLDRKRTRKWAARTIDIDILLCGSLIMNSHELSIPHPLMIERRFVLEPLCEMNHQIIHPITGLTMREHLDNCQDESLVAKLKTEIF